MEPANAKTTSSLAEFGTRKLENEEDVFDHNAWQAALMHAGTLAPDNVEWDEVQEEEARRQVQAQLDSKTLDDDQIETFDKKAAGFWDDFYSKNVNRFFKDRHWLRLEFPELFERLPRDSEETFTLCEMGCGAGNTVFPFLQEAGEAKVFVYACDYSKEAVGVVKGSELYDESRCKGIVYDITAPDIPPEIAPGSVDVCTCIFVLSAIHPSTWAQAVRNLYKMLKPGGLVLLRDYGRYDLAQLRFKPARVLEENFYVRGDGTRVYFFTNEELATMFSGFEVVQNGIDRRLLVNRTRKLKMYRSWVQAKLRKPLDAPPLSE